LNAASYDVSSMYPTMIVRHNISTDTVNCDCCCDDPNARVPSEVMKLINDYVMDKENKAKKQEPRPWHYWICKKRGKLAEVMSNLMELKRQYKKSGEKLKEKAIKILMNSGYGSFGNVYFEYRDPRVAELITAYGKYTIKELEKYAGDKMIYGDTDSIYLSNREDTIIAKAAELDVTLEFERVWKGLFLSSNKKQYFGITQEGKVIHKILKGMKSDQPKYFNEVTKKLVSAEFMELFINADISTNPLAVVVDYIKSIFIQLPNANLNELAFSQEAAKALYEYKNNGKE
jgi:DNA polymerase elongation subunit (family B)